MINRITEESRAIRKEVRQQTIGYVIGAFGLVAGLAWNEAIKALIDRFFHDNAQSLWAKFLYAVLITLAVVILSMYLVRLKEPKQKDPKIKDLGINDTEL